MPWLYQSFSPAEQLAPSISKHSLGWAGGGEGGWVETKEEPFPVAEWKCQGF